MTSRVTRQRAQGCARDARALAFGSVAKAGAVGRGMTCTSSPSARFSAFTSGVTRGVTPASMPAPRDDADGRASGLEHFGSLGDRAISRSRLGIYAFEAPARDDEQEALCLGGVRAHRNSVSPHVGVRDLGVGRPSPLRVLRDAALGARPSRSPAPHRSSTTDGGRRTAPGSNSCSEAFSRSSRASFRHLPEQEDMPTTPARRCRVIPPPLAAWGRRDTGGSVRESGRNSQ